MNTYKPPFTYTDSIVDLLAQITLLVGRAETRGLEVLSPELRKSNTIRTIKATLAIEGNTLSEEQITAILDGKKVAGQPNEILEAQQSDYYLALESSDREGESTAFAEFSLATIKQALSELIAAAPKTNNSQSHRLRLARAKFGQQPFSRKEYMAAMPEISTATASRDLALWCQQGELAKQGSRNQTKYTFVGD